MNAIRKYLFFLSLWAFLTGESRAQAPDALVRAVSEEVLALIRADKELAAGNQKRILEVVEAKVLPHFSFALMTRLAMGRNWRETSAEQRQRLTNEFRTLLVRTYTTALTQYRNQTVDFKPVRMAANDSDVVVQTLIKKPGGAPVAIDYSMEKTDSGWMVYNVKIEGISLIENYRNTFNSEIQKHGVDGLIKSLVDKNRSNAQAQP
jgi:phospholipid transport system substrate-binding protein